MPETWNFTFETIWPMVQIFLGPFGWVITALVGIALAGTVLGFLTKLGK